MFSFYVHSSLVNFTGFRPDDVFYGTLIQDLTKAVWGDTSVAVRSLMQNALKVRGLARVQQSKSSSLSGRV